MKELIDKFIETGEHVFVKLSPRKERVWTEEGVIKRLDANGWFQIEFMGTTNGWHVNQVQSITTD